MAMPAMLNHRQQLKRDKAERLIAASLKEEDLTIAVLCRELAISRTPLCRLFAQDGGVQAYILAKRLEAVRDALLSGPHDIGLKFLADIWQFSDASHLARRFKQRYGLAPKHFQHLHRADRSVDRVAASSDDDGDASSAISDAERVRLLERENRVLKRMIAAAGHR